MCGGSFLDTDPWGSSAIPARCGAARNPYLTKKPLKPGLRVSFLWCEDYLVSTRMVNRRSVSPALSTMSRTPSATLR